MRFRYFLKERPRKLNFFPDRNPPGLIYPPARQGKDKGLIAFSARACALVLSLLVSERNGAVYAVIDLPTSPPPLAAMRPESSRRHRILGGGWPVARQINVTLSPSGIVMSALVVSSSISGGTATTKKHIKYADSATNFQPGFHGVVMLYDAFRRKREEVSFVSAPISGRSKDGRWCNKEGERKDVPGRLRIPAFISFHLTSPVTSWAECVEAFCFDFLWFLKLRRWASLCVFAARGES